MQQMQMKNVQEKENINKLQGVPFRKKKKS